MASRTNCAYKGLLSFSLLGLIMVGCNVSDNPDLSDFETGGAKNACRCTCNCNCSQGGTNANFDAAGATSGGSHTDNLNTTGGVNSNSVGGTPVTGGTSGTSATRASTGGTSGASTTRASTGGTSGASTTRASTGGTSSANTTQATTGGTSTANSTMAPTGGAKSTVCDDVPRPSESCANAVQWGFCGQDWFAGSCNASCRVCSLGTGGAGNIASSSATGGFSNSSGSQSTGGRSNASTGGTKASGGSLSVTGGNKATGGSVPMGGTLSTGGSKSTAGAATGGASTNSSTAVACSNTPLTGGTQHCSLDASGNVGSYTWTIWSTQSGGCITPYGVGAAFKATWNNAGDFLARVGLQWNETQTYDQLGTLSADYAYTKTGSGGGYSFIGIYGWSNNPLVEYYIVDDWFGSGPPTGGGTLKGTFAVDGGTYNIYTHTQVDQPSIHNTTTFPQYFSVRQTPRQCGHISITEHFKKWASSGMTLGKMYEAKILVEAGGGSGSIDFTSATVTAQ